MLAAVGRVTAVRGCFEGIAGLVVPQRRPAASFATATHSGITAMHPTERIVRQFHESWDLRDPDRGAEVIAEDCDFEDIARGEKLPGKEAYKADYLRWREAFPDGLCKVENVIGVLRLSLRDFPPTGRKAEVRYCSVMRVKDGMVVEGRDYYDSATIARQLGLVD